MNDVRKFSEKQKRRRRLTSRRWHARHKKRGREAKRRWNLRNPDAWRRKDKNVRKKANRRWLAKNPERIAYAQAKARCTNPRHRAWKDYGGRGVEFRFRSFRQFIRLLGPRPSRRHSLDRIDNDGHYEPGNVRWATPRQQARNRRRPS